MSVAENLPEGTTVGILTIDDGGLVEGVGSYEVFSKSINWASANESAEALGGHLAIITSQAEWELVKKLPGLKQGMFIGATDEEEEGTWKWVDGQPLAGQDRQPKPSTLGAEVNPTILEESKTMRSSGTGKTPSTGTTLQVPLVTWLNFPASVTNSSTAKVPRITHSSPFRRTNSRRPSASILKQNPLTVSVSGNGLRGSFLRKVTNCLCHRCE